MFRSGPASRIEVKGEKYKGLGRRRSYHGGHVDGQPYAKSQEITDLKEQVYTEMESCRRSQFTNKQIK